MSSRARHTNSTRHCDTRACAFWPTHDASPAYDIVCGERWNATAVACDQPHTHAPLDNLVERTPRTSTACIACTLSSTGRDSRVTCERWQTALARLCSSQLAVVRVERRPSHSMFGTRRFPTTTRNPSTRVLHVPPSQPRLPSCSNKRQARQSMRCNADLYKHHDTCIERVDVQVCTIAFAQPYVADPACLCEIAPAPTAACPLLQVEPASSSSVLKRARSRKLPGWPFAPTRCSLSPVNSAHTSACAIERAVPASSLRCLLACTRSMIPSATRLSHASLVMSLPRSLTPPCYLAVPIGVKLKAARTHALVSTSPHTRPATAAQ